VIYQYTQYANNSNHPANPSSQSLILTLLAAQTIINIKRGINRNPISIPGINGIFKSISDQPSLS